MKQRVLRGLCGGRIHVYPPKSADPGFNLDELHCIRSSVFFGNYVEEEYIFIPQTLFAFLIHLLFQ